MYVRLRCAFAELQTALITILFQPTGEVNAIFPQLRLMEVLLISVQTRGVTLALCNRSPGTQSSVGSIDLRETGYARGCRGRWLAALPGNI
jgi:hypothetical protein